MASIRSRSFLSFACAALVAVASTFAAAYDRVAVAFTAVYQVARDFVLSVPAKFEQPRLVNLARPVEMVQACAHALCIAKRERPQVRSQWRMCAST